MSRQAYTLFCDDIRQEVGNKLSFIGTYFSVMLVSNFPVALPKLCLALFATTPADRPFRQLTARVWKDDEMLVEIQVPEESVTAALEPRPDDSEDLVMAFRANLAFSPFQVDGPCRLRVRLLTEDGELKAGALRIELMATAGDGN